MRKGMRHRPIDRQIGADADRNHHKAKLVVETVGKHTPHVVLDDREKDRERCHQTANDDQEFGPGKAAGQGIDRKLGCESRQNDCADDSGLWIGVLQPAIQQRERGLDPEGDEDQPACCRSECHGGECKRSGFTEQHGRTSQEQYT